MYIVMEVHAHTAGRDGADENEEWASRWGEGREGGGGVFDRGMELSKAVAGDRQFFLIKIKPPNCIASCVSLKRDIILYV
jgi:hypothetical protein